MKKRKGWKLTHTKYGDEYYMDDVEFKIAKEISPNLIKEYNIQRVIILSN